jgi:hypothetical protein
MASTSKFCSLSPTNQIINRQALTVGAWWKIVGVMLVHGFRSPAAHSTGGYAYSTATRSEEVRVRIMAHRVIVGKKPANKIGRLNIGEIAALRSQ